MFSPIAGGRWYGHMSSVIIDNPNFLVDHAGEGEEDHWRRLCPRARFGRGMGIHGQCRGDSINVERAIDLARSAWRGFRSKAAVEASISHMKV